MRNINLILKLNIDILFLFCSSISYYFKENIWLETFTLCLWNFYATVHFSIKNYLDKDMFLILLFLLKFRYLWDTLLLITTLMFLKQVRNLEYKLLMESWLKFSKVKIYFHSWLFSIYQKTRLSGYFQVVCKILFEIYCIFLNKMFPKFNYLCKEK